MQLIFKKGEGGGLRQMSLYLLTSVPRLQCAVGSCYSLPSAVWSSHYHTRPYTSAATLSLVPKVWAHPFASRYEKVPLRGLMDGHRPPQPIKLTGQQISPQQLCYRIRLGTFNALFKPREGSSPKLQCIAFSIRSAASFKEWECFRPTYY